MAWPVIAAAGISAAGSIGSSLLSKGGKSYSPNETLRRTVKQARRMGIHPLAALGTVSPYSTGQQMGIGPAFADAANALAGGLSEYQRRKDRKADEAAANRLLDSQVARNSAEAALFNMESRKIAGEIINAARRPPGGYGVPDQDKGIYIPQQEFGDDKAENEEILGEIMPFGAAQRNEDAGGEILGGIQTVKEWLERRVGHTKAAWLRRKGHVCVMGRDGKYTCSASPIKRVKPKGFRPR